MSISTRTALAIGCALLCVAARQPFAGEPSRLTLMTGVDYSTGKYGASSSTDILYVPVTAKYDASPWSLKLTVPWIRITGPRTVIGAVDPVVTGSNQSSTQRVAASGLGDVVASAAYGLVEGENRLFLDLVGKVKFGTADEQRGLGTGKNDYSYQIDGYRMIGDFTALGTLGYRVVGSPTGLALNNVWLASMGAARRLASGGSVGILFDAREAARPGTPAPRELTAYSSHPLGERFKLQFYVSRGLSHASADWGAGAMIGVGF
jgi:hypothetical protein